MNVARTPYSCVSICIVRCRVCVFFSFIDYEHTTMIRATRDRISYLFYSFLFHFISLLMIDNGSGKALTAYHHQDAIGLCSFPDKNDKRNETFSLFSSTYTARTHAVTQLVRRSPISKIVILTNDK